MCFFLSISRQHDFCLQQKKKEMNTNRTVSLWNSVILCIFHAHSRNKYFVFFLFTLFMANFQFEKFVNMSAEFILASGLLRTSKNTIFKRLTTPAKANNIDSQVFFSSSLVFEYDDDDSTVKVQMCVRHTFY